MLFISTVSASPQLRILEGAGAANYPPFKSGTPEGGNIDYTFYAPRVFNGRLHYDHVSECPTEEPTALPSSMPSSSTPTASLAPSVTETITTKVSYAFYVEHDPDQSEEYVKYDMSTGTSLVLDKFVAGKDAALTGYAKDDGLVVDSVKTRVITPREIGCKLLSCRGLVPRVVSTEFPHTPFETTHRHLRSHSAPGMPPGIRGRRGHARQDGLDQRGHVRAT